MATRAASSAERLWAAVLVPMVAVFSGSAGEAIASAARVPGTRVQSGGSARRSRGPIAEATSVRPDAASAAQREPGAAWSRSAYARGEQQPGSTTAGSGRAHD